MRSRPYRCADVPYSGVDEPRRTVFENSLEELGYKAPTFYLPKSQYKTNHRDAVYSSGNSNPGYALYEENTRDFKRTSSDEKYELSNPHVN